MPSYYHTIILARVTPYLTDTNPLGYMFGAPQLTITLRIRIEIFIKAAREPTVATNRGVARVTQSHCKQRPLMKGHNPPTVA